MSAPFRPDLPHIPGNYPGRGAGVPVTHASPPAMPGMPQLPPRGDPIIFPWWYIQMPGSLDWEMNAINEVAVAGATTNVGADFTLQVPSANRSVLNYYEITVLNPTTALDLRFELLVNGGPVPGWSRTYIAPLNATAYQKIFNQVVIKMDEGDTLTARVTEGSGSNFTYSLIAKGWHTPKLIIDSLMNGVKY